MKKVIFYGALKELFCESLTLKVNNLKDIFKALYCNFSSYNKKMRKLQKNCSGLAVVLDGKLYHQDIDDLNQSILSAKTIEIVPCAKFNIFSSIAAILVSIGVQAIVAKIIAFVLVVAISIGISYLVSSLMKPGDPKQLKTASYIFSSRDNSSARNSSIPISYGRLMLGSSVISAVLFSFDSNYVQSFENAVAKASFSIN